jgi:hypothetical protein
MRPFAITGQACGNLALTVPARDDQAPLDFIRAGWQCPDLGIVGKLPWPSRRGMAALALTMSPVKGIHGFGQGRKGNWLKDLKVAITLVVFASGPLHVWFDGLATFNNPIITAIGLLSLAYNQAVVPLNTDDGGFSRLRQQCLQRKSLLDIF